MSGGSPRRRFVCSDAEGNGLWGGECVSNSVREARGWFRSALRWDWLSKALREGAAVAEFFSVPRLTRMKSCVHGIYHDVAVNLGLKDFTQIIQDFLPTISLRPSSMSSTVCRTTNPLLRTMHTTPTPSTSLVDDGTLRQQDTVFSE